MLPETKSFRGPALTKGPDEPRERCLPFRRSGPQNLRKGSNKSFLNACPLPI
jgi:hypothetical protein